MEKTIIGLTGQSGAGKSTVAFVFENEGFYIIDADKISKEVTSRKEVISKLTENFDDILFEDKTLNKRKLAKIVFSDKEELKKMNNILFPLIEKEIMLIVDNSENAYILLDAPQLFESGMNIQCDNVVSVVANKEKLLERIVQRDSITVDEAKKRLNSQYTREFFEKNSDFVIYNNSGVKDLIDKTQRVITSIKTN